MNHYDWLHQNIDRFSEVFELKDRMGQGVIGAHGDKCYGYKQYWEENKIPFHVGVAIYFLSYFSPYSKTVRETRYEGWKDPKDWVVSFFNDNQEKLKEFL